MGNYIVSARKYRPAGFDEVIGQEHITTTLQNAIESDQLAQALLFCGPRGVGKTTCARIVAKMINNFDMSDTSSSTALNIYELDAASNNSVDDIRNLIDQVRYPPQLGKYKVYIIDEVHMLSNAAFNAFLKTLEEPPPYAIFILATTEKHKVIPTILSRCQIFDFNRINISDITNRLAEIAEKENIEAEAEALHLIAQKADGALRDALSLFDLIVTYSSGGKVTYQTTIENLHILDYDYYFQITDHLINESISETLLTFNEILKKGFDGQNFVVGLAEHLRNLMVCKDEETVGLLEVSETVKSRYIDQTEKTSLSFLLTALNILNECDLHFKSSRNQRLHVELALLKIAHINAVVNLADLEEPSDEIKKKIEPEKNPPIKESFPEIRDTKPETKPVVESGTSSHVPVNLRKTIKIPEVQKLKEKVEKPEFVEPEESEAKEEEITATDFAKEDLMAAWTEYAETLKNAGKDSEFNIMNNKMQLSENFLIEIHIRNKVEEDILDRFKADLLTYLRNKLSNNQIKISTILKNNITRKTLYTNTDKFDYLAKKNPVLRDLKSRLGLDTDF